MLALPIDYSTSITAETANGAALLLADDVAQLDGYRGSHFGGWRELDGPVGRWLADDAPERPAGQIVVANLGVGAHDVAFGSAVLDARRARRASATLVSRRERAPRGVAQQRIGVVGVAAARARADSAGPLPSAISALRRR